jgi:hypothetical protein
VFVVCTFAGDAVDFYKAIKCHAFLLLGQSLADARGSLLTLGFW